MGIRRRVVSLWGKHRMRACGVDVGNALILYGIPFVSREKESRISLGNRVALCSDWRANPVGVHHPVILRTLRGGAEIIIGDDTGISGGAICAAKAVHIGAHCLLGANVTITDTDFHALAAEGRRYNAQHDAIGCAPVTIEDNVWLGMNVIVLKGVTIGTNTVVGAGSVVVKSLPPNVIACGAPARPVQSLSSPVSHLSPSRDTDK